MQVLDVISDLWTAVKGTSGRVHVYAGGDGYTSAVTITRPSNATAYTAGDVIGVADVAVAANAGSAIHEFTSAGASGAAWDLPANDRAAYLGYIDIGTAVDVGSTLYAQADQINKQIKLASGSTSVFGLLVTTGAYTPASATVARVRLHTASL
jgi:hypothetical protein